MREWPNTCPAPCNLLGFGIDRLFIPTTGKKGPILCSFLSIRGSTHNASFAWVAISSRGLGSVHPISCIMPAWCSQGRLRPVGIFLWECVGENACPVARQAFPDIPMPCGLHSTYCRHGIASIRQRPVPKGCSYGSRNPGFLCQKRGASSWQGPR